MPNTDRFSPITDKIYTILDDAKTSLGVMDVYYGDQELLPRTPAVTVESGAYSRELAGMGGKGMTENRSTVYVMVYFGRVQDVQQNSRDADALSEAIMDVLHTDVTLEGLIVHGHVSGIEPGYATRRGVLLRSARVTWNGLTKTQIF